MLQGEAREPETDGARLARMGTDAAKWAAEWVKVAEDISEHVAMRCDTSRKLLDEGWMITWFANAIEAGRNAGYHQARNAEMIAKLRREYE